MSGFALQLLLDLAQVRLAQAEKKLLEARGQLAQAQEQLAWLEEALNSYLNSGPMLANSTTPVLTAEHFSAFTQRLSFSIGEQKRTVELRRSRVYDMELAWQMARQPTEAYGALKQRHLKKAAQLELQAEQRLLDQWASARAATKKR